MPGLDFLVLFGLSFVFIPCKGVITEPRDMTEYTFLPGRTVNITWVFNDVISTVVTRAWSLANTTGPGGDLAEIYRENKPSIRTKLYDVDVVEPATLVLKNVNQSYNGIYTFTIALSASPGFVTRSRSVRVFIANLPEPIATTCTCTSPRHLASTQSVMKKSVKNGNITSPTTSVESENEAAEECNCSITEWHVIVISLVSGMIIGILLCYTVSFSRRKFGIEKHRPSNPNPSTSQVDSTYQELDLAKINKEDNYQSLRGNAAKNVGVNGDDSTYSELSKTRDVENNYQSLT